MFSDIHFPFGSKPPLPPEEKNKKKLQRLNASLMGVKKSISQLKGEDQIGPKIIPAPRWYGLHTLTNGLKGLRVKVLEYRKGLIEEKITKLSGKAGIIHSGEGEGRSVITLSESEQQQVRRRELEEKALYSQSVIENLEPDINRLQKAVEQRESELKAKSISEDDPLYERLGSDELVASDFGEIVKDILKVDVLAPDAREELLKLDKNFDEGGTEYGDPYIASRVKDLYVKGRIFESELDGVLEADEALTKAKNALASFKQKYDLDLQKAHETLSELAQDMTTLDFQSLSANALQALVNHASPEKLISLSADAMTKVSANEITIKTREKEIEERVKQELGAGISDDIRKEVVGSAIESDTVLLAYQKELGSNKLALPYMHAAMYDHVKNAPDAGERDALLAKCDPRQQIALARMAQREESPLLESICNAVIAVTGKEAERLVDRAVGEEGEPKEALEKLTSEERVALRKEIASAINAITDQLKASYFTDEQRQVLQTRLERFTEVNKILTSAIRSNANKHLLDVMKTKSEATSRCPGFSLAEMQEALLTMHTALLSTNELFAIIGDEVKNPACPIGEKKQLLQFLGRWCERNQNTGEMKRNRERLDGLLAEIENLQDERGKKMFADDVQQVRGALEAKVVQSIPKKKSEISFQSEIVNKLLAGELGTKSSYDESVKQVANDLLLFALDDYLSLTPDDLFYAKWEKRGAELNPSSPVDRRLVGNFNKMSNYITSLFIRYPEAEQRAALIKFFINVAMELKNQGNIHALMGVYGALTNTGVLKMYMAQKRIKGYDAELNELKVLTDPSGGYSNIFKFMQQRKAEGKESLAYLGATKPRILKANEGNPELDSNAELYNFSKCRYIKNELDQFLGAQETLKGKKEERPYTTLSHEIASHKIFEDKDFDARVEDLRGLGKEQGRSG